MDFIEILKAILFGIVEGITEWLPISSTGHMILLDEFVKLNVSPAFWNLFLVVIQLGAILAVVVLFFDKLNPFSRRKTEQEKKNTYSLWGKVIVGAIPAAIFGVLLDDFLEAYLNGYIVVAITLVAYGVAFILVEKINKTRAFRVDEVGDLTYRDALTIGAYQVLSLIPGTSRSGSTILGGILSGVSRAASAEFSFFMAIPIMLGASGLKVLKFILSGATVSGGEIGLLLIGMAVAFAVSLLIIKFLMDFVRKHSFAPFGIYRIVLGVLVLGYFIFK